MLKTSQVALADATEWLGDWHPLSEQLGSADGLLALGSVSALLRLPAVHSHASLRRFLQKYQAELLLPLELRAIQTAQEHTARNELRELLAQDTALAMEPRVQTFANASQRVGRTQLQKLRPLRDQRMVQRYLAAVERQAAYGWHTLVYGMTLEVYSLPSRQGLLGYAQQLTRGFIYAGARSLRLSEHACRELFEEICEPLPAAVEELLRQRLAA